MLSFVDALWRDGSHSANLSGGTLTVRHGPHKQTVAPRVGEEPRRDARAGARARGDRRVGAVPLIYADAARRPRGQRVSTQSRHRTNILTGKLEWRLKGDDCC